MDIHSGAERPQGHPHPEADHLSGSGFSAPLPRRGWSLRVGAGAVLKSVVFWRPFGVSRRLLEDGHPRSGREFRDHRGSCVIARGVAEFSSDGLRAEGAWDRPLLGLGLARGGSGSLLPRRLCWPRAGGTLVPPSAVHGLGPPCPWPPPAQPSS